MGIVELMLLKETEHYVSDDGAVDAPSGFRRTEVGVIPTDWEVDRVDENASIKTGSRNTQDRIEDGEYPFFVRSQQVERINSYSFDGEAVLTAGDGVGTGKVFHYVNGRFDVHQRVYRISNFSDRLNGRYFFYQFSTRFYDRIMSMTAKSSVDSVRMEMIAGMKIPLPPPCEQRAIAQALSDVDELVGALEALVAKKRAMKQATLQQLLNGKTRLSKFSGDWETISLGELFEFKNGLNKSKRFFGHGTPIVNYMDVFKYSTLKHSMLEGRVQLTRKEIQNFDVRKGDVFFTRTSETTDEIGIATVMLEDAPDTVFSGFVLRARPKTSRIYNGFKAYCFASKSVRGQIVATASYTTRALTNGKLLSQVLITLPEEAEQIAISETLSDMDAEISALKARVKKVRAIKQGMMQQLLTGRIRLVKPQPAEAEA